MTGPDHHDQPTRPSDADDHTLGLPPTDPAAAASLTIPGFTIGEKLGEGGMGVVFLARQHHPNRPVALKVIRGGPVADPLRLRLFRREADTLARLQHPGIAAIYEVGATASGQHYLAMELVQGPTLAAWLRAAPTPFGRDDLNRRLGMMAAICHAVHYAHQRGVIHRDLKPANLVVQPADPDAAPAVKILDFGLARVVDADEFQQTMFSQPGTMAGTLPYMSPEQARGDTAAVDVRSDVYALGVILQEMLTGALPYETSRTSIVDAVRTICEAPPRNLRDGWLGPGRPDTDLQTIVAKALAKDADERYASAAALAEDLERYLTSQPILARPPSTMYQLRKLVARRKAPFAAAAAIVVLLVVGAVGMSGLYVRAEHNLKRAMAAERQARTEAETANRTADFLVDIFGSSDPTRTSGETGDRPPDPRRGRRSAWPPSRLRRTTMQARMMHVIGAVYRQLRSTSRRELVEGSACCWLRRANPDPADDLDLARSSACFGPDLPGPATISTPRDLRGSPGSGAGRSRRHRRLRSPGCSITVGTLARPRSSPRPNATSAAPSRYPFGAGRSRRAARSRCSATWPRSRCIDAQVDTALIIPTTPWPPPAASTAT
ncbi:MAG: serine/threonine-protein kinase [Candidatus Krumholzibacteriia bacterium]